MNKQKQEIHKIKDVEKPLVSSVLPETAYYPGFGKHGKKINPQGIKFLIPYASATIEVVRLLNDEAARKYKDIVEAYKEPECRAIIEQLLTHNIQDPGGTYDLVETFRVEGMTESIIETMGNRMGGNKIPPMVMKTMEDFVLLGFNREVDIKYGTHKVTLERSDVLFAALVLSAFTDSIDLNVPLYDAERLGDTLSLFGDDPRTRAERRRKARQIAFYKKHGFGNVHKQTLMYGAVCWYKARVNPGKSVDVWSKFPQMNESTFSNLIKPYDYATGHPARPR